jgi:thiol-disulfide isomerase/thioredoxin/sugar lactone lactonase YvrE
MFGITRAPELDHPGLVWLNVAQPLSLCDLRGRLVILDFWTFCCINCLHTLPILQRIERAYPADVAVIGIHSPKFDHERDPEAVANAIRRYDVQHAVAHDPESGLWEEYCIRAWPSLVFISPDGMVIGQMAGEPDPEMLFHGIGSMLEHFRDEGSLCPSAFPPIAAPLRQPEGRLRFPGKIKSCPGPDGQRLWAIADSGHHQVVLVDDHGNEQRRWGSGSPGFVDGDGDARFNAPEGLACSDEAIFVADTRNHAIRRIDRASNCVTTIAGTGERGGGLRAGQPALDAALASPWDLDVHDGTMFFANAGSHQIGGLDLAEGLIVSVAGGGGEGLFDGPAPLALLAQPSGLARSNDGRVLYFVDSETSSLRALGTTEAGVRTLIGRGLFEFGQDDGPIEQASLQHPLGLASMPDGRLVVADSYNNALRMIDLEAGRVTSLSLACADSTCLPWSEPAGIVCAGTGRLLLSDTNNHRICEIDLDRGTVRTWLG